MSDILASFGVQGDTLAPQRKVYRPRVAEKVAHIDADFISYQIAADTRDEMDGIRPMRTLQYKIGQIEDIAQEIMERAGCGKYVLHITPGASTKGGRDAQAVQKEYQATRKGKDKPEHLDIIRGTIGEFKGKWGYGLPHLDQEADDGMAQAGNDSDNNVICSMDKDLRMAPGWHMDMNTDELIYQPRGDFGWIDLDDTKSTKKVVGYGPKFFWAQCLMGDPVDNVQGIPVVSGYSHERHKSFEIHQQNNMLFAEGSDFDRNSATGKRLWAAWVKSKSCGPVSTYEYLKDVDNNKDAWTLVTSMFKEAASYSGHKFVHWKTGLPVTPMQALGGDMRLLWMRLSKDPDDVLRWLKQFV